MSPAVATSPLSSLSPPAPLPPTPYTIVIDTREGLPYDFSSSPFKRGRKHYRIASAVGTLRSGDYSLAGFETRVAIERKSKSDLFNTLGQGRARFTRELERLAAMEFAAVVVEAEWSEVLTNPPERSQLRPTTVFHSVMAWMPRYPRVHWIPVKGRAMGTVVTARLLDWWHRTNVEPK